LRKKERAAVPGTAALLGLLLLQTPGLAERTVGRSSKFWNLIASYHLTVNDLTIKGALHSSFLPGLSFLRFFTGFGIS
jgi:hypothetical protein